jgi:uncharacterized iron-regulated protein
LHAGFIPRTFAKKLVKEGEEVAIKAAVELDYIDATTTSFEGTDLHYNMFEAMISGREMWNEITKPSDSYRKIFKAQILKDDAMAYRVAKLLKEDSDDQKYLVIAGKGHV